MSNIVAETKLKTALSPILFDDQTLLNEVVIATIKAMTPEPKTRLERLTDEYRALEAKHQSLKLFMMTDTFRQMDKREKLYMDQQSRGYNVLLSAIKMRLDFYGVYV